MVYNSAARLVQDGLAALHYAREYVARRFPGCGQACGLLGAYALAIGFGDFLVEHFLLLQGKAFLLDLTPVFRRPNIGLYVPLVCYLIGCLAIIGGIGGAVLLTRWPTLRRWLGHCVGRLWPWLFGAALALPVFTSAHLAPLCGGLAAASLLVMWWLRDKTTGSRPFSMARGTAAAIATVLVLGAMSMMAAAWYPLRIGNDYIELDDSLKLPALDTSSAMIASMNRSAAISCFIDEANREPDGSHAIPSRQRAHAKLTVPDVGCAALTDERNTDRVMNTLKVTGAWQSNAGRTLYHHAYVFVPALHLLSYGLAAPIPTLYGLGNTAFHALLLSGEPSVTRYFATFPIAQLVGILAILGAVLYFTRSLLAVLVSLALCLIALAQIGYPILHLAPGFSPLRYAGLAVQLASIALVCRGRAWWRPFLLIAALIFALIWNKEFAVLGFFGQALALLSSPHWRSRWTGATLTLAAAVVGTGVFVALGYFSRGFLSTINVGFFGIAMPLMDDPTFSALVAVVAVASGALWWLGSRFPNAGECAARRSTVPVLALLAIKYIYYFAAFHMWFTLAFVLPMSLAFFDWRDQVKPHRLVLPRRAATIFVLLLIAMMSVIGAVKYARSASDDDKVMTAPFIANAWHGLGETFSTPIPAAPIEQRVQALRQVMLSDDTLLLLSPFDHLLAFYANPQRICGHFELVTNLVTYSMMDEVADCVLSTPHSLIVYDEALDTPCPVGARAAFIRPDLCEAKHLLMHSVKYIFRKLRNKLTLVKTDGSLTFYRLRDFSPSISQTKERFDVR